MPKGYRLLLPLAFLAVAKGASAADIGAYYVETHGTCNINLPGTKTEVRDFVASRPPFIGWNYMFGDGNVWPSDWMRDSDWYISSASPSLFDGADSSNIVYIATHGVTSNGVFSLGMNAKGACGVNSTAMALGNQRARYLFLSTCQSLKAGDGANPNAAGESPALTWASRTAGVRCLFGYSTNMRDDPRYGKLFWQKWLNTGTPNSKAFLDASWDVNHNQVPMVMCYGASTTEADYRVEREDNFSIERPSNAYATIRWYWASPTLLATAQTAEQGEAPAPKQLHLAPVAATAMATVYPGIARVGHKDPAQPATMSAAEPRSVAQTAHGWRYLDLDELSKGVGVTFDDAKAIALAKEHLVQQGLWRDDLIVAAVRHEGQRSLPEAEGQLVGVAVEFKQQLAPGLVSLDARGSILVGLSGNGRIASLDVATASASPIEAAGFAKVDLGPGREARLAAQAAKLWPSRAWKLVDVVTGYVIQDDKAVLVDRALADFGDGSRLIAVELPVE